MYMYIHSCRMYYSLMLHILWLCTLGYTAIIRFLELGSGVTSINFVMAMPTHQIFLYNNRVYLIKVDLYCDMKTFISHSFLLKPIPATDRGSPQGCETSRLPYFLDNRLTDGGKVVSLTRRPPFTPQWRFLVLFSVRGWVDPRAIVRLEG
jgi:hypothetical protein